MLPHCPTLLSVIVIAYFGQINDDDDDDDDDDINSIRNSWWLKLSNIKHDYVQVRFFAKFHYSPNIQFPIIHAVCLLINHEQ